MILTSLFAMLFIVGCASTSDCRMDLKFMDCDCTCTSPHTDKSIEDQMNLEADGETEVDRD
jgi:hypothetical protein